MCMKNRILHPDLFLRKDVDSIDIHFKGSEKRSRTKAF